MTMTIELTEREAALVMYCLGRQASRINAEGKNYPTHTIARDNHNRDAKELNAVRDKVLTVMKRNGWKEIL